MHNKALLLVALATVFPPLATALEVGASAPGCELTNLTDNSATKVHNPGKVSYVDFWASWCGPCAQSMPFMNALHEELKDRGLEVIAINLDEERQDADAFLQKHPVKFTIAANSDLKCPVSFEVQAMPSSYLIDKQGKIRHIQLGFHVSEEKDLRNKVQSLLDE